MNEINTSEAAYSFAQISATICVSAFGGGLAGYALMRARGTGITNQVVKAGKN